MAIVANNDRVNCIIRAIRIRNDYPIEISDSMMVMSILDSYIQKIALTVCQTEQCDSTIYILVLGLPLTLLDTLDRHMIWH